MITHTGVFFDIVFLTFNISFFDFFLSVSIKFLLFVFFVGNG